jgi:hypothetical protein
VSDCKVTLFLQSRGSIGGMFGNGLERFRNQNRHNEEVSADVASLRKLMQAWNNSPSQQESQHKLTEQEERYQAWKHELSRGDCHLLQYIGLSQPIPKETVTVFYQLVRKYEGTVLAFSADWQKERDQLIRQAMMSFLKELNKMLEQGTASESILPRWQVLILLQEYWPSVWSSLRREGRIEDITRLMSAKEARDFRELVISPAAFVRYLFRRSQQPQTFLDRLGPLEPRYQVALADEIEKRLPEIQAENFNQTLKQIATLDELTTALNHVLMDRHPEPTFWQQVAPGIIDKFEAVCERTIRDPLLILEQAPISSQAHDYSQQRIITTRDMIEAIFSEAHVLSEHLQRLQQVEQTAIFSLAEKVSTSFVITA